MLNRSCAICRHFSGFWTRPRFRTEQVVNYASFAREVGVSAPSVRGYFEILTDTLLGCWLPAYRKRAKRRIIESPRFYFFDIGIVNELAHRGRLLAGSITYGAAFEHFIFMELRAHSLYSGIHYPMAYWRTASGFEVDFIVGGGAVAIEVKSIENPAPDHLRGLRAFKEEHHPKRCMLVCRVARPRKTDDGIEIIPWRLFLRHLWEGRVDVG
jgi:predicted AAA+ superfamily ATPase